MSCGRHTADYDYHLPPDRIAQTAVEPRDHSRLLVLNRATGDLQHRRFKDLPDLLRPGDTLIANQSRVIPARLFARRPTGGRVELLLLRRTSDGGWEALAKPGRRLQPGQVLRVEAPAGSALGGPLGGGAGDSASDPAVAGGGQPAATELPGSPVGAGTGGEPATWSEAASAGPTVTIGERSAAGIWTIYFSSEEALDRFGSVPLPPYIKAPPADPERYQTVYARAPGSAAAPTAGLHFTPELIDRLRQRGQAIGFVTLHVGLDTFRPVEAEETAAHVIHSEWCELPSETADLINATRARGNRIVAVGTTSVRVLETAGQGLAPGAPVPAVAGPTRLYIQPGFPFRVVDALITNFHLPRSSLLFLVSALAGRERILAAYQTAIAEGYRFYSFGDAMLIE